MSKELITKAEQIRDEVRVGANTAKRVGGFLEEMAREVNGLYNNMLDWINNEKPQGGGFILTQSDVVNNLTDESELKPLSAKQGRVLKEMVENGANGSKLYSFCTPLLLEPGRSNPLVLNSEDVDLITQINQANNSLKKSEFNYCGNDSSGNQLVVPLAFYSDLYGGEFQASVSYTDDLGIIYRFGIVSNSEASVFTATPLTRVSDGVDFLTTPNLIDPDRTTLIQLSNRDANILMSYFKGNKKPLFYVSSISGGNNINIPLTIVGDLGVNPEDGVVFSVGYTVYSDGGICIAPGMPGEYYIRMEASDGIDVTAGVPNKSTKRIESKSIQLYGDMAERKFYTNIQDNSICNPGDVVLIKTHLLWGMNGTTYRCNVSTVCHVQDNSSPGMATLATCIENGNYNSDATIYMTVQPQGVIFKIVVSGAITNIVPATVYVFKL